MQWHEDYDWVNSPCTYGQRLTTAQAKAQFDEFKSIAQVSQGRRQINSVDLNELQKAAHDMIVSACLLNEGESSTDGGDNIGRLHMLLGAGGCGKSFVIDAVITTLTSNHGWNKDKYSVHATTGKAATNVNGSTFQNFKDGLGIFSSRQYRALSPTRLLQVFKRE